MGLKEFKEKIIKDSEFAKKFEGVTTPEDVVKLAGEHGFNFTVEDVKANTELCDEELEAVAGGAVIFAKNYFVISDGNGATIFATGYFVHK